LNLMGLLPDKDRRAIEVFKKRRDGLAHVDMVFFPNYDQAKKDELADMAIAAADAAHDLSERMLNLPSPYFRAQIV
jgi:hypothetical protein